MFYKNFFKRLIIVLAFCVSFPSIANDWLYTVRPNEAASQIGNKYLTNPYRIDEVLVYNQVGSPSELLAGTVLKIPLDMLKFGPARVQVVAVQGQAELLRKNTSETLSTLHSIRFGDTVKTASNSSVMLKFADKSELLLGSNSELIFDVLTQWGRTGMVDSRMRLMKGSAEGRVEKLQGPGAHFEVHTPSAVATVRGTEFRVRVNQDNVDITYNEVSEGKVQVENAVAPLLVPQGFGVVSEKDKAADKPIELLRAPSFIEAEKEYPAHPVTMSWHPDPKATAYRVELFTDDSFKNLSYSTSTKNNSISFDDIASATYAVRVRAIDINGLEGLDAKHFFDLKAAPRAPAGLMVDDNRIAGDNLTFNWQNSETATGYRWQLASNSNFDNLLINEIVESNSSSPQNHLAPATYAWRVAAINEHGEGYFSEGESFSVQVPAEPKVNEIDDVELEEKVTISWSSVQNASEYHWQLATDKSFNNIIDSNAVQKPLLSLTNLAEGDYYFRVAAKGPHNENRFSETQSFQVFEAGNGKNPFMLSSLLLILLAL